MDMRRSLCNGGSTRGVRIPQSFNILYIALEDICTKKTFSMLLDFRNLVIIHRPPLHLTESLFSRFLFGLGLCFSMIIEHPESRHILIQYNNPHTQHGHVTICLDFLALSRFLGVHQCILVSSRANSYPCCYG